MLARRMMMVAPLGGDPTIGTALLYKGLWILPNYVEPDPIELPTRPETVTNTFFSDISMGTIRTFGEIGEWYDETQLERTNYYNNPNLVGNISLGTIRTFGDIGEWYTLKTIGEGYEDTRLEYPGSSYMATVVSRLV